MHYPNNLYASKQNVVFLNEIKGDLVEGRNYSEKLKKLQRGITTNEDIVHNLGIEAFPNIPEYLENQITNVKVQENESFGYEDDDSVNTEAIQTLSRQIDNHKVPAIKFIIVSTVLLYIFMLLLPYLAHILIYNILAKDFEKPIIYMEGIALTRNYISMLSGYIGRLMFQELDDPFNSSKKL